MRSVLRKRWPFDYRDFSFSCFTVVESLPATKPLTAPLVVCTRQYSHP